MIPLGHARKQLAEVQKTLKALKHQEAKLIATISIHESIRAEFNMNPPDSAKGMKINYNGQIIDDNAN